MRDREEQTRIDRKERVPFGIQRRKLNISTEMEKKLVGKVTRWINDTDSRISDAQAGGYEFVQEDIKVGDAKTTMETDRRKRQRVGTNKDGSPQYSYLMAIKREFYEEDQAKKEETNKKVDLAIRGGAPTGLNHHGVSPNAGGTYVKNIDYQP